MSCRHTHRCHRDRGCGCGFFGGGNECIIIILIILFCGCRRRFC
ncbi:hypothetical protein [Clostridium tyrobutyricum]|nr:hypothetical protein [Clostridium tyrobutyricum]